MRDRPRAGGNFPEQFLLVRFHGATSEDQEGFAISASTFRFAFSSGVFFIPLAFKIFPIFLFDMFNSMK